MKNTFLVWLFVLTVALTSVVLATMKTEQIFATDHADILISTSTKVLVAEKEGLGSASSTLTAYTNDKLGFSVNIPETVMISLMDCNGSFEGKKSDHSSPENVVVPFIHSEISKGVVFYPEWYGGIFGKPDKDGFINCRKVNTIATSLLNKDEYRNFPYWTILSDVVNSEKEISRSVSSRCSGKYAAPAVFMGLTTTTQSGVFEVGIDVDLKKVVDSSVVFCPDLILAKYVPSTKRIYYLFNNGQYNAEDPTFDLIKDTLHFKVDAKE